MINLYNIDSLKAMQTMKANIYDLAIVDPPYGIDAANDVRSGNKFKGSVTRRKDYDKKDWDKNVPSDEYFTELKRVSKKQIIWGVNYFDNGLTGGRIFWDKGVPDGHTMSSGEIAYKSMGYGVDLVAVLWSGMLQNDMKNKETRIHPTQKPVALYKKLLLKYAKDGYKILDTHGGSMSIAIACHDLGYDLDLFEIDKDYFKDGAKRLELHQKQLKLKL